MKTREEVEALKRNWLKDPVWTLAETGGFEEYAVELAGFEAEHQAIWAAAREKSHAEAYRNTPASETTLRDWFAVHAMEAFITNIKSRDTWQEHVQDICRDAYIQADAMMAARKVQP